jgi:hypothetical protein
MAPRHFRSGSRPGIIPGKNEEQQIRRLIGKAHKMAKKDTFFLDKKQH